MNTQSPHLAAVKLGTTITLLLMACGMVWADGEGTPPSKANLKKAADYSAANQGRAMLVMVKGKTIFERYDNGFGPDTATHLHSATKGFWGPVVAAMIEDGLVESFDEMAVKTLPEWKDDPLKKHITIRHLLNLSAGLVQDVKNLQGHERKTLAPDLYKHAIGVRARRRPGIAFQYGPSCYYVLGEIMKRKLAPQEQTPLDYLKKRILDPIGIDIDHWVHDKSSNPHIPNGASLTARNWVRYGQWLVQGGRWDGKQIVKKELLDQLLEPSKANPGHGLALWLNRPGGQGAIRIPSQTSRADDEAGFIYRGGHPDLFAALGAGKCRMYMIPSLQMVVLRQADTPRDRFDDNTFLGLLLTGKAHQADDPAPENRRLKIILERLDRNGDGKIQRDEAGPRLKEAFDRLDSNGSGALEQPELHKMFGRLDGRRPDG